MHFVHSFWTKPYETNRWYMNDTITTKANVLLYTLSFLYLKSLNQKVVLYTDDKGKELLDFIPYDEIYLTLNDIPQDNPVMLWAQGKMYAMKNEPLDAIHIDADVMIMKNECIEKIKKELYDNDALVQHIQLDEFKAQYISPMHINYPEGISPNEKDSVNNGILAFNNQNLKDTFLNTYFNTLTQIKNNEYLKSLYENDKYFAPDLVVEQRFLYDIIKRDNYTIGTILGITKKSTMADDELGYLHYCGKRKFKIIQFLKQEINKLNPEIYNKAIDKLKQI